jgi:hypothetical protein
MESLTNIISNPTLENVLRFVLSGGMFILIIQVRIIMRRIRLSEFKHIATVHALGKSLGNGFMEHYKHKLDDLIDEFNFKTGK